MNQHIDAYKATCSSTVRQMKHKAEVVKQAGKLG